MHGALEDITKAVGNTPIVRLNRVAQDVASEVYVKCEFLNPGGSHKDRLAWNLLRRAEENGLRPGGTIVEATSGNTGASLALLAAIKGYKCVFVMPDKMSQEKISGLRAFGAKVVVCPTAVDADDPRSYYKTARRIADETPNCFYANQYHNPANPEAHYLWTGPEIWKQTQGDFDAFVAGMGTGGTVSGCGKYFKEQSKKVQIVGVDPVGSLYYDFVKTGRITKPFSYKVEGIGEDFFPTTMNLKMLGIETIWVKAANKTHHRILSKLGTDRVILPEQEMGRHIAQMLHNPAVVDYVSLGNGYSVVNIAVPERMSGQPIAALKLGADHDLRLLGLMRGGDFLSCERPETVLQQDDKLILLGRRPELRRFGDVL